MYTISRGTCSDRMDHVLVTTEGQLENFVIFENGNECFCLFFDMILGHCRRSLATLKGSGFSRTYGHRCVRRNFLHHLKKFRWHVDALFVFTSISHDAKLTHLHYCTDCTTASYVLQKIWTQYQNIYPRTGLPTGKVHGFAPS